MERTVITITEYCRYHQSVEPNFIRALVASGLIHVAEATEPSLAFDELEAVERYARLHYDLDINVEGLEAIAHLMERMRALQDEVRRLQERAGLYGHGTPVEDL